MEPQGLAWSGMCHPRSISTSTVPSTKVTNLGLLVSDSWLGQPWREAKDGGWAGGQAAGLVGFPSQ